MADQVIQKIKKALGMARSALIVCHVDPDADTIGSMIAMSLIAKQLGIKTTLLSVDPIPTAYHFLPDVASIKDRIQPSKKPFDLAITVDVGDIKRIGEKLDLRKLANVVINIDHHPDNTHFGDINYVRQVSSAAELVFVLCKALKVLITKPIATCLYTAVITDTGNFSYENTCISTFNMAAELVKAGASPNKIAIQIYDNRSISFLRVLSLALKGVRADRSGRVIWTSVTNEMVRASGAQCDELTGIVDHLRQVKGSEVAVLFRETPDGRVKINLRSKGKVNVQKIAAEFKGGGHKRASGISVKGDLREIERSVLAAVLRRLGG